MNRATEVFDAWSALTHASGIHVAIERNIKEISDELDNLPHYRRIADRKRLNNVVCRLREIDTFSRPSDPDRLNSWLRARYDQVVMLNRMVVEIHKARNARDRIDHEELSLMSRAYSDWERKLRLAKAEVNEWPDLVSLCDRAHLLVKYWWLFCINDPRYFKSGEQDRERKRAYEQAEEAVLNVHTAVMTSGVGVPFWRVWLTRAVHDRRAMETVDRMNSQV